jgi:hypothetical protein
MMFVGMDVHRNCSHVCVPDGEGCEVFNRNLLNNVPVAVSTISWWRGGASVISGFCAGYG